jgi:hypothetical protein
MRERQASRRSTRAAGGIGRHPSCLCRFVVSALVLSVCIAAGASALLTETDGPYYVLIYSDPTPLVAGNGSLEGCASSRADDASDARRDETIAARRSQPCPAAYGMREVATTL